MDKNFVQHNDLCGVFGWRAEPVSHERVRIWAEVAEEDC